MNLVWKYSLSLICLISLTISNTWADAKLAYQEMQAGKAMILDVREKDEVNQGMLKGATWIPLSDAKKNIQDVVKRVNSLSQNKKIYIYCRSGKRAGDFIALIGEHQMKADNLGGLDDLVKAGLPTQPHP